MTAGPNGLATSDVPPRPVRHGRISILLALIAPILVLAAGSYMGSLPKGDPQQDLASVLTLLAYAVAAPLLHLTGIGFGVAGLLNANASRAASAVGVVLNVALVAIGLFLGWAAVSTIGAFT